MNTMNTWSSSYQAAYDLSNSTSRDLKKRIDALPEVIQEFYSRSQQAASSISKFWEHPHSFQFSLVVSIVFAISERHGAALALKFDKYKENIDGLKTALSTRDLSVARRMLSGALRKLDEVIALLREQVAKHSTDAGISAIDQKVDYERLALCELEKLRVRSIALIYFGIVPDPTNPYEFTRIESHDAGGVVISRDTDLEQRSLISLYEGFCEYLERPHLSLRPVCMVMFFKQLLATGIRFPAGNALTRKNLEEAYEFLDSDGTLPRWSIYRVLLPRARASQKLNEVKLELEQITNNGGDLGAMSSLRGDFQRRLVDALGYALRSTREHLNEEGNEHRGDLVFGFEENEPIRDQSLIVSICWTYTQHLGNIAERILPAVRDEVLVNLEDFLKRIKNTGPGKPIEELRDAAVHIITAITGPEPVPRR